MPWLLIMHNACMLLVKLLFSHLASMKTIGKQLNLNILGKLEILARTCLGKKRTYGHPIEYTLKNKAALLALMAHTTPCNTHGAFQHPWSLSIQKMFFKVKKKGYLNFHYIYIFFFFHTKKSGSSLGNPKWFYGITEKNKTKKNTYYLYF